MDLKNVDQNDYCLTLELHKSMFFIDMLKDIYEFTLKGDEVEIFKKLKSGISEPITRKELIYSIQVEMAEKYKYSSIKKKQIHSNLSKEEKHLRAFYIHFDTVDSIHKAIDNIAYLEKYLNKKEVLHEEDDEEEESIDEEDSTDEQEQVGSQKTLHVPQLEEQLYQAKLNQNVEIEMERIRELIQRYPAAGPAIARSLNNHH
jgi:hypothetical protein